MTKIIKNPTRSEIRDMSLAVRDAYLNFDQEDYCNKNNGKDTYFCNDCFGCIQYKKLVKAYKIAKKYLPKF